MFFSKFKSWVAGLCVLALVGCGGGGGGDAGSTLFPGDGGSGGGANSPTAKALQIRFSEQSVENTGLRNVVATVTAIDSNGQGVSGVPLTLAVNNNATFAVISGAGSVTGADGTVVAEITIGNDYSVRTISMTASGGGVTAAPQSFEVVGSRVVASDLTITAPNTITNSVANSVTVSVTAVDASRNALSGIPVTLTVDKGATIVPSGTVTDSSGVISGVVRIGQDQSNRTIIVKARSGTVEVKRAVRVIGATLTASAFSSTVATSSAGNRITLLLVDGAGGRMSGYPITAGISGQSPRTGVTNDDGQFSFTYDAPSAPQVLVLSARAGVDYPGTELGGEGGAIANESIQVVGTVVIPDVAVGAVTSPSVSASPSVVQVNPVGATTINKTEVRALFLGANNAPIRNVRVRFDLDGDPQSIGGVIDSNLTGTQLYSDANGIARTTYAPGTRFSPKDGVTLRACWGYSDFPSGTCPNSVKTTLTVVSESLSVSIGTNGTVSQGIAGLTYIKRFAVQVVDSAGAAKAGVLISPSIDLLEYYKGIWEIDDEPFWEQGGYGNTYPAAYPSGQAVTYAVPVDSATPRWVSGNVSACGNEDLNRNGVAETFTDSYEARNILEDQNGSATSVPQRPALDPRKADVTISVDGLPTTSADGIVVLKIEYPQNIASWVRFNILVSASGVAGTEGRANFDGVLPVLASAVTAITADPPFRRSPYGVLGSPTYRRKNAEGQEAWLCTNPN